MGRNPKSGERVLVPEKRVPHFKAGKELRERVDRSQPAPAGVNGSGHPIGMAQASPGAAPAALHEGGLNLVRS
ncbi:Integration host factor subunit beta [compost metagenome]